MWQRNANLNHICIMKSPVVGDDDVALLLPNRVDCVHTWMCVHACVCVCICMLFFSLHPVCVYTSLNIYNIHLASKGSFPIF